MEWSLWDRGEVFTKISGIKPLLASWESKTNPAQIRLQKYLNTLSEEIGPLVGRNSLFIHMDIDVEKHERLERHYDLENYLTPVVQHLGHEHFCLVSATKRVGGGSQIYVGTAEPKRKWQEDGSWEYFACNAGSGSSTKRWKVELRDALGSDHPLILAPGPVDVRLAWKCAKRRNWVSLWKSTGDAMGPVLGESDARNPFNPEDDRIVRLELNLNHDDALQNDIVVGMWWRPYTSNRASRHH